MIFTQQAPHNYWWTVPVSENTITCENRQKMIILRTKVITTYANQIIINNNKQKKSLNFEY